MDLVSVVIAVYNAESTIRRCVDSILRQTYSSYEVILVNDCSEDKSGIVCLEYAKDHTNIFCFSNTQNMGVSASRNKGIRHAKGKYICFLDSDDYVDKEYLEKLVSSRIHSGLLPICGFSFIDETQSDHDYENIWSKGTGIVSLKNGFELYDETYLGALWNKLFDLDIILDNNIRFDEDLSMGEDLRFSVDYLKKLCKENVYVLSEPLYKYVRVSEDSLMSKYIFVPFDTIANNIICVGELVGMFRNDAESIVDEHLKKAKYIYSYNIVKSKKLSNKEKRSLIVSNLGSLKPYIEISVIIFKEKAYHKLYGWRKHDKK